MPLFKKQLARPKWIREKEKRKWWHMTYPKDGIDRGSQYETDFERGNAGFGAIASLIFGVLVFGLMVGIVVLVNWIGRHYV